LPTQVIMPALEMAQDSGKILKWLKREGDAVKKGEPLLEIETDKAAVEIEAPADGILRDISARDGDVVPVGKPIAWILAPGEQDLQGFRNLEAHSASPVAQQIARKHGIDLSQLKTNGARIEKADVLSFMARQSPSLAQREREKILASPKARRLARESNLNLEKISGTGPDGAIIAADILAAPAQPGGTASESSSVWKIMAERTTASWTSVPHFFLLREVNASCLVSWRAQLQKRGDEKITYTDLLVKLVAASLRAHPRVNAQWDKGVLNLLDEINIGIAVATEKGLVVPVIPHADALSVKEIAARRADLAQRANENKLRPADLRGGTFTISNLGMYGVDAFTAIIHAPQAALLAVGRIADRVVPAAGGAPGIAPMLTLSLSCDHRVIDGARGAQFLQTLAELIEEPLNLLV